MDLYWPIISSPKASFDFEGSSYQLEPSIEQEMLDTFLVRSVKDEQHISKTPEHLSFSLLDTKSPTPPSAIYELAIGNDHDVHVLDMDVDMKSCDFQANDEWHISGEVETPVGSVFDTEGKFKHNDENSIFLVNQTLTPESCADIPLQPQNAIFYVPSPFYETDSITSAGSVESLSIFQGCSAEHSQESYDGYSELAFQNSQLTQNNTYPLRVVSPLDISSAYPSRVGYATRLLDKLGFQYTIGENDYAISASPGDDKPKSNARELMDLNDLVNDSRGFNNISDHYWIGRAYNCGHIQGNLDYKLYVAVLRPGVNVSAIAENGDFSRSFDQGDDAGYRKRAPKGQGKAKKKKPSLKPWDPMEVFYPLGYISPKLWIHMSDLAPDQRYTFDIKEFQSAPPNNSLIIIERQNDTAYDIIQNQYDSFYLRYNSLSGQRECYCGCCKTWHKRDQCNWLHHMKSAHGIRSRTKQRYALPHIMAERPDKKTGSGFLIGFCDKCQSWQNINNSRAQGNYASWFLHQAFHDVETNKLEGRSGKKLSRFDVQKQQALVRSTEAADRARTICEMERLILGEFEANNGLEIQGKFFQRAENFMVKELL